MSDEIFFIKETEDFPVFVVHDAAPDPWGGFSVVVLTSEEFAELRSVVAAYSEWQERLEALYYGGVRVPSKVGDQEWKRQLAERFETLREDR